MSFIRPFNDLNLPKKRIPSRDHITWPMLKYQVMGGQNNDKYKTQIKNLIKNILNKHKLNPKYLDTGTLDTLALLVIDHLFNHKTLEKDLARTLTAQIAPYFKDSCPDITPFIEELNSWINKELKPLNLSPSYTSG